MRIKTKILVVFGTRPEAIKMVPVVKKLEEQHEFLELKVCVTAQHRQMLDQVLEIFRITPDFDLNVMKPDQDLYSLTASVLVKLGEVFGAYGPTWCWSTATLPPLFALHWLLTTGKSRSGMWRQV